MGRTTIEAGMALGDRIRELREAAGLTRERLAHEAGITLSTLQKLEQGHVIDPNWSTVRALAIVLNVDMNLWKNEELKRAAGNKPPGRPPKKRRS